MRHMTWIIGLLLVFIAPRAQADIIIFEHESVTAVTGRIGDIDFTAPFIITAVGNTDDRERQDTAWFIDHSAASIHIEGVGDFDIWTPTRTFMQELNDSVGFSRAGNGGLDLFNGPSHSDLHDWDMLRSVGPVSGVDGLLGQWDSEPLIETSGGILFFDERFELSVVFTATVIPAPGAFALLGSAWVLRGLERRRHA